MVMKKTLLTAVAAFAALTLQAQTWTGTAQWSKSLTPVDAADQLGGTNTTVGTDGSVFTTGTYNQEITFGSSVLINDSKLTSAYIAKYKADGTEAWAQGLYGASIIRTLDTDEAGNVYIAGVIADKVVFESADGKTQTLDGVNDASVPSTGFVAKYDANGNLVAARTIVSQKNATVEASGLYYPNPGDVYFAPGKVQVSAGKLYLSATYTGDVTLDNMSWTGRYLNVFDFMYTDIPSAGILTLNAADLTGAASVMTLMAKDNLAYTQMNPESVNFTVDGSTVYAGFVAKGTQSLTTAGGSTDLEMTMSTDDSGNTEHAFILAKIVDGVATSKIFHVAMHDKIYGTDRVGAMALDGGKLYVGGTYYGELGFNTEKKSLGSADMFVACLNPNDFNVDWAVTDGYDEGDVNANEETFRAMLVNNGLVFIAGADRTKKGVVNHPLTYNIATDGTLSAGDNGNYAALFDNGQGQVAAITNAAPQTTVTVYGAVTDGISSLPAADNGQTDKVYGINGQRYDSTSNLPKGIYIVGNKKIVVK